MRILVAAPYYALGSCALYLVKAVGHLGHVPIIWDYRTNPEPPDLKYEVALSWTTERIAHKLKCRRKILIYPDDADFWDQHDPARHIRELIGGYNEVYTVNKINGYDWMPMGYDEDLHRYTPGEKNGIVFIGTLRDKVRLDLVLNVGKHFQNFKVYGNNWPSETKPCYYHDFVEAVSRAQIVINQHYSDISPSTKDMEIAAIGGGMLLTDSRPGVMELLPSAPTYDDADDLILKLNKWIHDPAACERQAKKIKEDVAECSYTKQVGRILEGKPWKN